MNRGYSLCRKGTTEAVEDSWMNVHLWANWPLGQYARYSLSLGSGAAPTRASNSRPQT